MDILMEYYMNTNNDPSEEIVEMLMELFVRDVVFPSHWRLLSAVVCNIESYIW